MIGRGKTTFYNSKNISYNVYLCNKLNLSSRVQCAKNLRLLIRAYANIDFVIIPTRLLLYWKGTVRKLILKSTITIGRNVTKKIVFKHFTMVYLCRNR